MIDITQQITAVRRHVGHRALEAGEGRTVTISQSYPTDVDDLWDACTNPERLPRWFAPVSGELRLGGRYQIEGNAEGTVERCDPPKGFAATWEFAGATSWIEVRLSPDADGGARFELEHLMEKNAHWDEFGPGATGMGYDMALTALALHVTGSVVTGEEATAWWATPDGKRFFAESGERWYEADVAGGTPPDVARGAADRCIAAYSA
ncbi:MAG: SRPBCC family protein [Pseudonocardia sp.]